MKPRRLLIVFLTVTAVGLGVAQLAAAENVGRDTITPDPQSILDCSEGSTLQTLHLTYGDVSLSDSVTSEQAVSEAIESELVEPAANEYRVEVLFEDENVQTVALQDAGSATAVLTVEGNEDQGWRTTQIGTCNE